ncbi:MAG: hypothetical protein ACR65R_09040 [Methylomicrobium sp.]
MITRHFQRKGCRLYTDPEIPIVTRSGKKKGLHRCKPLFYLAPPDGLEPPTR